MVRGENKKFTITVRNKTTGAVIDCSAATGILLGAYQEGGKILQQWSKVVKAGFGTIDVTNAATGILVVYMDVSNTLAAVRNKMVRLEGEVSFANANYVGGHQISIDTNVEIEEFEPSIFEGVSPV